MKLPLVNPDARIRVERRGHESQPVIVIDDLLADAAAWRAQAEAEASDYGEMGAYYPGLRSPLSYGAASRMRDELAPLIAGTFGVAPPVLECFFSIVTTAPERLQPIQRLPHVDGLEPARLALLVYLSGAEQGGTAFYRQRGTGFETVDEVRFPAFKAALDRGIAEHGMPPAAYIGGDTPLYERIARYDAAPNRALIYRSHALHCAAIAPGTPLPADPATGRLSINSFLFDPSS